MLPVPDVWLDCDIAFTLQHVFILGGRLTWLIAEAAFPISPVHC